MDTLITLHQKIDTRVQHIREQSSDWPCSKGCDQCCRQLARVPQLTASEWAYLRDGLLALPPEQRAGLIRQVDAFSKSGTADQRPVTCPLLDKKTGACPIYAVRPVACRTYGFYVQRDGGLYCADINTASERGELTHVIWGNHDVIDRELATFGETRPLTEWFEREFAPAR